MAQQKMAHQALVEKLGEAVTLLVGEEMAQSDGLRGTPERIARMWEELTSGAAVDVDALLSRVFSSSYDQMVVVRDIDFVSTCEHHLMPFWGTVSVGYLPSGGKVVGLSKIARLVKAFARRFQIQERMTQQIAEALAGHPVLRPAGVGVVVRATHSCMRFRGAESEGEMATSCLLGTFRDEPTTRAEFFSLIEGGRR